MRRTLQRGFVLASVAPSRNDEEDNPIPLIMLRGRRVMRFSVRPGIKLRIDASHGCIVITLVNPPPSCCLGIPDNFVKYQRERSRPGAGRCGRVQRNHGGVPCLAGV